MMKTLNQHSTKIFCLLLDRMNGGQHLKIENDPFMPLTIEKVGGNVTTYWGEASLYSLCHYYVQNFDLMQDPEMCFIVVDQRGEDLTAVDKVKIVPYMYQQANLAIYEESITFEGNEMDKYDRTLQLHHVIFANQWLQNIQEQGFLKRI
ncbi:hypothetical protein [Mucilaginibacter sp.]|jgi:hypothetical protein|uniref:DUF6908 domain-containing protein n=1 Tax=Mucilaginibacter sp. TaxID=1882438 RepID=UPI0035622199